MSNEVTTVHNPPPVATWTPEQTALITNTVAKGASRDELQLFLYRCKNMGLDPLKPGQIHFIKYNANSVGTIVVGIEGFRSIAGRSGKHVGTKRGVLRDDKGKALGGWAEVFRSDWKEPARLEVSLAEYNKGSGPWKGMPETMIQKVAEAGALRMAFPDDLGGVYEQSEMDQAGTPPPPTGNGGIHPEDPEDEHLAEFGANDPNVEPSFTRGSFAKRKPSKVSVVALRKFVEVVEKRLADPNPKTYLTPEDRAEWEWNVEIAARRIADFENSPIDPPKEPGSEG
jgi:phage recombination protein Bet